MLDKEEIIRNFSRSAVTYDQHAVIQKKMADGILRRLGDIKPSRILDVGCGTGYLAGKLAQRFRRAEIIGIDLAPGMIEIAGRKNRKENIRFAVGDGERLPFPDRYFDLIISNAALQWMDQHKFLVEAARLLMKKGKLLVNTFGPGTLKELAESGFMVNDFISAEKLEHLGQKLFSRTTVSSEIVVSSFGGVRDLLLYLKAIGAQSADKTDRPRNWSFKRYREKYGGQAGVSATFEIISAEFIA